MAKKSVRKLLSKSANLPLTVSLVIIFLFILPMTVIMVGIKSLSSPQPVEIYQQASATTSTELGIHGLTTTEFLDHPLPKVNVLMINFDDEPISDQEILNYRDQGYKIAISMRVFDKADPSQPFNQDQLVESAKSIAKRNIDYLSVDEIVWNNYDRYKYSKEQSVQRGVTFFNAAYEAVKEIDPKIKVGIAEPRKWCIENFLSSGGIPDFVSGEDYGGAIDDYLGNEKVNLTDLESYQERFGVDLFQWVVGVEQGLSYVGEINLVIFADIKRLWWPPGCRVDTSYLEPLRQTLTQQYGPLPEICVASTLFCVNNDVKICNNYGTAWRIKTTCAPSQYCLYGGCFDSSSPPYFYRSKPSGGNWGAFKPETTDVFSPFGGLSKIQSRSIYATSSNYSNYYDEVITTNGEMWRRNKKPDGGWYSFANVTSQENANYATVGGIANIKIETKYCYPDGSCGDAVILAEFSPTPTPTRTPTPTNTPTPIPTTTPTPIKTPTSTPTGAPTSSPTQSPTQIPTNTPTPIKTPTPSPTPTPNPACKVDLDQSGLVGANDLRMVLVKWGQECSGCLEDINLDGRVNNLDSSLVSSFWGESCSW